MAIFIVTLMIMLLGIAMISVRIILKENGEFHGSCSSRQVTKSGAADAGCVCGRRPGQSCPNQGKGKHGKHDHDHGHAATPAGVSDRH